jgi:hypothetical protein
MYTWRPLLVSCTPYACPLARPPARLSHSTGRGPCTPYPPSARCRSALPFASTAGAPSPRARRGRRHRAPSRRVACRRAAGLRAAPPLPPAERGITGWSNQHKNRRSTSAKIEAKWMHEHKNKGGGAGTICVEEGGKEGVELTRRGMLGATASATCRLTTGWC